MSVELVEVIYGYVYLLSMAFRYYMLGVGSTVITKIYFEMRLWEG